MMTEDSHHLKWVTAIDQQNVQMLRKVKEEIVTEYVLLQWEVFWQEGTSGTSSDNFSQIGSVNISHISFDIPTQRKTPYK